MVAVHRIYTPVGSHATRREADDHLLYGNGADIWVDNKNILWIGLTMTSNTKIGENFSIQTHEAFIKLPWETAATYGGTMFTRTGTSTAIVVDQLYHYDVRAVTGWRDILRNIMNEIGKPVRSVPGQSKVRNNGTPFMIHYENPTINFKIIK